MPATARHFPADPAPKRGISSPAIVVIGGICLAATLTAGLPAAAAKNPYEVLAAAGIDQDIRQGYALRADTWSGDLPADGSKRIEHTLFRGNDYHFYAHTATKGAKISFHIQDRDGALVEARAWQTEKDGFWFAGADINPKSTSTYCLVVKIEQSTAERTDWALLYAYK